MTAHLFRHQIETSSPIRATEGRFSVEGWCIDPGAAAPPALRLNVAGLHLAPRMVERPDVVAAKGASVAALRCGWHFDGTLSAGVWIASLEAQTAHGPWTSLQAISIVSTGSPLQAAIEHPAEDTIRESVRVQGWCAHPEQPIAELWLHYGNQRVRCEHGLPRNDIAALLPGSPDRTRAGFISVKNLPVGLGPLRLHAVLSDGGSAFVELPLTIDIARDEDHPAPLDLHEPLARLEPARRIPPATASGSAARPLRVLFVLYGDFTANSALHVVALANALAARGHECAIAVPDHVETVRVHRERRFRAVTFSEALPDAAIFNGGRRPDLVHAWTTREDVRRFCQSVGAGGAVPLVVHLEDHEQRLLEAATGRSVSDLLRLPEGELDSLVPPWLSHPRRGPAFLESASGVSVIWHRLRELLPAERPVLEITPAADPAAFFPRPIPWALREALGWGRGYTVLVYPGNVHATNRAEVRELYLAVLRLNRESMPTTLLRTGRDSCDLLGELGDAIKPHVIELGRIENHHVAPLLALADFFVQPGQPDVFNDYRFPSKLPEFFAIGRPVILPRTNLGERVRDGIDAYVLERADADGIARAIRELRANDDLRQQLNQGALAYAERTFGWSRSAARLATFYEEMLASFQNTR